jgi:5-(carboxyamino)imidazole ribonucleotide synthase
VVSPAPDLAPELATQAQRLALTIAKELDVVGILAVELFETRDGQVLVNELAMRPHNTGHWTQDGAVTSQFENHLRAVLGLPLGTTALRGVSVMLNIIGQIPSPESVLAMAGAHLHLYGKAPTEKRKLGHVTLVGASLSGLEESARALARLVGASSTDS